MAEWDNLSGPEQLGHYKPLQQPITTDAEAFFFQSGALGAAFLLMIAAYGAYTSSSYSRMRAAA